MSGDDDDDDAGYDAADDEGDDVGDMTMTTMRMVKTVLVLITIPPTSASIERTGITAWLPKPNMLTTLRKNKRRWLEI